MRHHKVTLMKPVRFEIASSNMPLPVMTGELNGHTVRVALDTAATGPFSMFVSEELQADAQLRTPPFEQQSRSWSDDFHRISEAELDEFKLGPIALRNARVCVTDALTEVSHRCGTKIDAVVGCAFLDGRRIEINYRAGLIDLDAPSLPIRSSIPFELGSGAIPLLPVFLDGRGPFRLALYTSAITTMISWRTVIDLGLEAYEGSQSAEGSEGSFDAVAFTQADLAAGFLIFPQREVAIAVDEGVEAFAGGGDGFIGHDLLATAKVSLDYRRRRFAIVPGTDHRYERAMIGLSGPAARAC